MPHPGETEKIPMEYIKGGMKDIFKKYDSSDNGLIDVRELYDIIRDVFEVLKFQPPPPQDAMYLAAKFDVDDSKSLC